MAYIWQVERCYRILMQQELSKYLFRNAKKPKHSSRQGITHKYQQPSYNSTEIITEIIPIQFVENFSRNHSVRKRSLSSRNGPKDPNSRCAFRNPENIPPQPSYLPSINPSQSPCRPLTLKTGLRKKSWLDKVLSRKESYAKHYFKQISATRKYIRDKQIDQTLPDMKIGRWLVHGYIYEGSVILRAEDGNQQVNKKYPYHKVADQVESNYPQWLRSKFTRS